MTIDAASSIDKKLHGTSLLQRIAENPQNRQTVIDWLEASKAAVTAEYLFHAITLTQQQFPK